MGSKIFGPSKWLSLLPRPGANLTRYHGIFAPNCKLRRQIVPGGQNIRPLIQVPVRGITPAAATLSAMVVVDELGDIRKRVEVGLHAGVIEAGATVQHDDDRALSHTCPVGDEL
jgi:hypothetical protein